MSAKLSTRQVMRLISRDIDKLDPVLFLNLPSWEDRDEIEQVLWLRANYDQWQLKLWFEWCMQVLDMLLFDSAEWWVLLEEMDLIFDAILPENRP